MSKNRKKIPQVLLVTISSIKASRDKLRGILKYARLHGPWRIHLIEGRVGEQRIEDIRRWGGTGVIVEAYDPVALESVIIAAKLPTVLLDPLDRYRDPSHPFYQSSFVRCDGREIARLAAEHLLGLHCRHFAFVEEIHGVNWSRHRREAFCRVLAEAGFSTHVYGGLSEAERSDWSIEQGRLVSWLRELPKPVGVMAANDPRGRQVIEACHLAGLRIPDQVAVIGVDNDEMTCETTDPPLSSVATDGESGGYRAAEILDALMRGVYRKQRIDYYGPLYVAQRTSTETAMVDDRLVARAIEFIRANASSLIGVGEVARHLKISKRHLEIRFKKHLNRTVNGEIRRTRLDRVRNYLIGTDLRMAEIAILCGFQNEYYLSTVFKKSFGITMREFRAQYRSKIHG